MKTIEYPLTELLLNFGDDTEPEQEFGKVEIWTDGSCWPNPGPGGWAAILQYESSKVVEIHGRCEQTTNNRMEITAAIEALKTLIVPTKVRIVTDSRYLQGGAARCTYCLSDKVKWHYGKPPEPWKLNRDLWLELMRVMKPHKIHWEWVRGHSGDPNNERCDALASAIADAPRPPEPPAPTPQFPSPTPG